MIVENAGEEETSCVKAVFLLLCVSIAEYIIK